MEAREVAKKVSHQVGDGRVVKMTGGKTPTDISLLVAASCAPVVLEGQQRSDFRSIWKTATPERTI